MTIFGNIDTFQSLAINALMDNVYYYCKGSHSNYLSCNDLVSHALSLGSAKDIVKFSDAHFGWSQQRLDQLRQIDEAVMTKGQPISHLEDPFILPNGKEIRLLSHKNPLRDKHSKIIGIVGISINVNELKNIDNTKHPADSVSSLHDKIIKNSRIDISKREAQCLDYLIKGKTAQETGNLLFISRRTVELYLDNLRMKFHCRKKSELFDTILQLLNQ